MIDLSDFGLKKNASGYVDPTAYEAIKNADLSQPGEIYSVIKRIGNSTQENELLIIKANEKYCNVLTLADNPSNENCIKVISKIIKYTDPGMLSYTFTNNPMQFIKRLSADDFKKVVDAIEDHFQITVTITEESRKDISSQAGGLTNGLMQHVEKKTTEATAEIVRYKTLYETFKDLYDRLLERMMSK